MTTYRNERPEVERVRDRDRELRRDEEEVQRESRQHGREQRGPDAAHERDDHDEQLEGEHLGGDRLRRAEAVEQPGEQRTADERDHEAERHALAAERPAGMRRRPNRAYVFTGQARRPTACELRR